MSEDLAPREEIITLLDEYEPLLSPSQSETLTSYYRYDLSLSEIADEKGVSRSAINDAIKKGIGKLRELESSLGLVKLKEDIRLGLEGILESEDLDQAKRLASDMKGRL